MANPYERLFTIRQLARELGNEKLYYSLRRLFEHEPGVINAGSGRRNRYLLLPESVVVRVLARRSIKGGPR
jgi:hypothetical protein